MYRADTSKGNLQQTGTPTLPTSHQPSQLTRPSFCTRREAVDALYERLVDGGRVFMELGAYPFSPRYAWLADRFGVSWQLRAQQAEPSEPA